MIYLFAGDDIKTKRSNYERFLKSRAVDTDTIFINRNNFNKMQVESLYSGAGLFSPKSTLVFEGILEYEDNRDFILEKLDLIGASSSDFVFLEGKLGKPILDAFKKARTELNIFELPKEKKEKFDNFLLANAFGQKDKLKLWVYFRQAVDKGVGLEELIGVLFWKAKDMILKRNFGKLSEIEVRNFTEKLPYLLPEARKKGQDTELTFERFILEAF